MGRIISLSLSLSEASAVLFWRRWFPEQGKTVGVTLRAASEVDMKDQEMVLSIIVDAIQFALQHTQKISGQPGDVISPEERVSIARAILAAFCEQGLEITRVPSEPR
jgi:hypothetical protein